MDLSCENFFTDELPNINKIRIPPIKDPVSIKLYWFQFHDYHKDQSTLFFKEHTHSFHEAHFVLRGSMTYKIDENEIRISDGEYLILPANTKHCMLRCSDNFAKLSLSFEIVVIPEQPLSQIMFKNFSISPILRGDISEDMMLSLYSIRSQAINSTRITPFVVQSNLFSIICHLYNEVCDHSDHYSSIVADQQETDQRYIRARKFIKDNIFTKLRVEDVANYVHISSKQLTRIFFEQRGMSVFSYISEQKYNMAKEMIVSTDLSLKEISEKLGFTDEFYFNKYFTKKTGITPLKFRKINGKLLKNKEKEEL